jgi:hypothetical protein
MITDSRGALRSFLRSTPEVDALTNGRVYIGRIPSGRAHDMPLKTVVIRGAGGANLINPAYVQIGDWRLDVQCYGETPYEADLLHRAVYYALKHMKRNVQGNAMLHWARVSQPGLDLSDPDTEWPYTLSVWQVLVSEQEVA